LQPGERIQSPDHERHELIAAAVTCVVENVQAAGERWEICHAVTKGPLTS
jgi:hypothetical protein